MSNAGRNRIWSFGNFILDEGDCELRRNGTLVRVERLVFELLVALARRRGELAARSELLAELWPDATVSGDSLKRVVMHARVALGEDGRRQAVIRTVYGRGYRLLPPVTVIASDTPRCD